MAELKHFYSIKPKSFPFNDHVNIMVILFVIWTKNK
ncbi:hypothetical protein GGE08_002105 [Muricauda sp. ARW1Y1]|jgi:hypothetical protein|nr:hypothetical protein [Muricauda sp. ARW1Y1]